MLQRWLGLWALRRAYRLVLDERDRRPIRQRLTREALRLLALAAFVVLIALAAAIAAVVYAVESLS